MNKQLTPAALVALKDALSNIYWYKKDLKPFLLNSLPTNIQINNTDWALTKREVISTIIDKLAQKQHTEILLKLAQDICQFNNFEHLEHIDNSAEKIRLDKNSVNHLKQFIEPYQEAQQAEELRKKQKKAAEEKCQIFKNYREELLSLKQEFCSLATNQDNQQRGFKLEKLMNKLFDLNDLDPKASFKVVRRKLMEPLLWMVLNFFLKLNGLNLL